MQDIELNELELIEGGDDHDIMRWIGQRIGAAIHAVQDAAVYAVTHYEMTGFSG